MEDLAVSLIETLKNERANRVVADRNLPAATAVGDAMKETRASSPDKELADLDTFGVEFVR